MRLYAVVAVSIFFPFILSINQLTDADNLKATTVIFEFCPMCVMIHGEGVRLVGKIILVTGLLRAGVVNEMIIWQPYVRMGVT